MEIFDKIAETAKDVTEKIKSAVGEHEEQIEAAIDQVGDFIDGKTGGKFADKVDQAQDFLKDNIGEPNA